MEQTRCRKRRKSVANKGHSSRRAVQALAAGAAIAAGTQAYADPIRFDNAAHGESGHFHWLGPYGVDTNWLDFMQAAEHQPGVPWGNSSLRHAYTTDPKSTVGTSAAIALKVQVGGAYGDELMGVDAGELIPSGFAWRNAGYAYYAPYGSQLPEGTPTYLGFRFDLGSGYQYGWIGVTRTVEQLEAFAWGYETEAGVPIPAGAIPEPGTLAALALGAAAALTSRRWVRSQID